MIQEGMDAINGQDRLYGQSLKKEETSIDIRTALIVISVIGVVLATIGAATLNVINNNCAMAMIMTGGAFVLSGVASIISCVREYMKEKKKAEVQQQETLIESPPLLNEEVQFSTTELEQLKSEIDQLQNENHQLQESIEAEKKIANKSRFKSEKEKKELEEKLEDLEREAALIRDQDKLWETKIKELEHHIYIQNKYIDLLKTERGNGEALKQLQQKLDDTTNELKDKQDEIELTNGLLEEERKESTKRVAELSQEIEKLKTLLKVNKSEQEHSLT